MPNPNPVDQVGNIFEKVYETKLLHAFQQKKSKLMNTVTSSGFFVGDKLYFPKMGAVVAQDLQRLQEVIMQNGAHELLELSCKPRVAAMPVADVDKEKLTPQLATEYANSTKWALDRDADKIIYDALLAEANKVGSSIITIGNYNNDIAFDDLIEAVATIDDVDALDGEDIFAVMPARPRAKLSADLTLSMKRAEAQGIAKGQIAFLNPLDDLNVVSYSGCSRVTVAPAGDPPLNAGVIGTDVFVYVRASVGAAANDAPKMINERLGLILANMVGCWAQQGAIVKQVIGIIRIKCRRNNKVTITPLPMKQVA